MSINDGGQAFPTHPSLYSSADQHLAQGMSLRDWFAGQAMAAFIRRAASKDDWVRLAPTSYEVADAMLAAHNSTPTKGD